MTRRYGLSRKRRILKWAGTVACGLLVLAIVLSQWWFIVFPGANWIDSGAYWAMYNDSQSDESHWAVHRKSHAGPFLWFPATVVSGPWAGHIIPLWIPLALIGIPTILAWRRDRPIPPGHCRTCRYDLTGNESGVCPECGTEVAEP